MKEFRLPEIGEGIEEATVVAVLAEAGSFIAKDAALVELETDKAAFELPCPFEGTVENLAVSVGDKVKVGGLIASIDESKKAGSKEIKEKSAKPEPEEKTEEKVEAATPEPEEKKTSEKTDTEKYSKPAPEPEEKTDTEKTARQKGLPPSSPSAKTLARELGIDVSSVKGTGARGRISSEDVRNHTKDLIHSPLSDISELPDFGRWGETERLPLQTVGKISARRLALSWANIPHVTQHDTADITELENLRKNFSAKAEKAGGKLTMTAIMVRVIASALGAFPKFNGSFDAGRGETVFKKYVNIGIAVDTERGLVVPVIKNAGEKNIIEISIELADIARRAREKNIKPDELQGATFTVSNLGGIGGDFFTPIVNFPEVAILGISRSKMKPVYDKESGQFKPRLILPLSLSYDHRMIDGAEAARFSRWIAEAVEEPFKLVFEG